MHTPGVSTTLDQLAADSGWLRRLARSLVNDPAAAEDLVQDAYVLAAEQSPDDGRPLRPWLVRVLLNLTRTRRRSAARRDAREDAVARLAGEPMTPAELVGRVEIHRLLAGLVLELAPGSRDVVLLRYFEGLSSAAIATRLGLPAGTVRWRLKQAIDELRERLDHREPNRAWLPALTAFAGRTPAAGLAVPWLGVAAIALLIGIVWLVTQIRADVAAPRVVGEPSRVVRADQAAPSVVPTLPIAPARRPGGKLAPSGTPRRLDGRVLDAQRQPVEGAAVAVDCGYGEAGEPPVRATTTARGLFSLEVDETCNIHASATKDDRMSQTMGLSRMPLVLTLVPRIALRAHVVDAATGAPIAGAEVTTTGPHAASYRNSATTDDRGDAQVYAPGLPAGLTLQRIPDLLFVRAAGYVPALDRALEAFEPGSDPLAVRTIRLTRGIAIRGQLIGAASYAGATLDVIGPMELDGPVEGSPLWIRRKGAEGDHVAADGRFEARLLGPGRYWLAPRVDGLGPTVETETRIDVGPDGRSDVVIHLGAQTTSGIAITVVDPAGKPVAGAVVTTPRGNMRPFVSDARGEVTVPVGAGPGGGPYQLVARSGSLASEIVPVALRYGQLTRMTLPLRPTGLAGVVVDADGTPVPGAEVYRNATAELGLGQRATTDAQGRFALDVPLGTFVLSVRRSSEDDFEDDDDVRAVSGSYDLRLVVP